MDSFFKKYAFGPTNSLCFCFFLRLTVYDRERKSQKSCTVGVASALWPMLISQRESYPHTLKVSRGQASFWQGYFLLFCVFNFQVTFMWSNQFSGFWGHTNTAAQSLALPWFNCENPLRKRNLPGHLPCTAVVQLIKMKQFVGCSVCSLLKAKQKSNVH